MTILFHLSSSEIASLDHKHDRYDIQKRLVLTQFDSPIQKTTSVFLSSEGALDFTLKLGINPVFGRSERRQDRERKRASEERAECGFHYQTVQRCVQRC